MKDFLIDLVVCVCIGATMWAFLVISYGVGL
jgi:hypothetical protein